MVDWLLEHPEFARDMTAFALALSLIFFALVWANREDGDNQ